MLEIKISLQLMTEILSFLVKQSSILEKTEKNEGGEK